MQIANIDILITEKKKDLIKLTILIISPFLPYPPRDGGKLKMYNSIKSLTDEYDIILLSFIENIEDEKYSAYLKTFCKDVVMVLRKPTLLPQKEEAYIPEIVKAFYSQEFKEKLDEIIKRYKIDILQTEYTFMAYYTRGINNIPKLLIEHDTSLFSLLSSYEKPLENGYLDRFIDWLKKMRFHKDAYRRFDKIIVFTEEEKIRVKSLVSGVDISVIPMGLDLLSYNFFKRESQPLDIIFMGYMGHYPNIDGILYFCNKIFPLIQAELPEVSLHIIGSGTNERLSGLSGRRNIFLVGEVENVYPFLAKSKVFIAPLRLGGGIKVKILEAMAMGLPVVATSAAARGLKINTEEDIVIADNPKKFAKAVISLMKDEILRNKVGGNARLVVDRFYNLGKIKEQLKLVYKFQNLS
jgi:glycosyltransferase involved in cell wall biosynthesis